MLQYPGLWRNGVPQDNELPHECSNGSVSTTPDSPQLIGGVRVEPIDLLETVQRELRSALQHPLKLKWQRMEHPAHALHRHAFEGELLLWRVSTK
jgi:hypothetical protein